MLYQGLIFQPSADDLHMAWRTFDFFRLVWIAP
jgi:hypothetical protein